MQRFRMKALKYDDWVMEIEPYFNNLVLYGNAKCAAQFFPIWNGTACRLKTRDQPEIRCQINGFF
jgi:hypothetical protein